MRRAIIYFTLACFVTTQTAALAAPPASPSRPVAAASNPAHEEGLAAGRTANPIVRGTVTQPSAAGAVPGYTTQPPETQYYGRPDLKEQGNANLLQCASTPNDPVCQAKRGAVDSANSPRERITVQDPAVAAARQITRQPGNTIEDIASFYGGCTVQTTNAPVTTEQRVCMRYQNVGRQSCTRDLSVSVEQTANCTPGDWIAHAGYGTLGLDVQCRPRLANANQHFRVTGDGGPLSFFDVDMGQPLPYPRKVASFAGSTVWITGNRCTGEQCNLTAIVPPDQQACAYGDDSASCFPVEPIVKRYADCPAGTQSGNNIFASSTSNPDDVSAPPSRYLEEPMCYAPSEQPNLIAGFDITGGVPGSYWSASSERAVVGWMVNPLLGAVPEIHLPFKAPLIAVTETDRWSDQCPALTNGRCSVVTSARCVDGPATKQVDGAPVTRDCWRYETTLSCEGDSAPIDECASLISQGCTPVNARCKQKNPTTDVCEVTQNTYSCTVPAQQKSGTANCPSNVVCVGASCFDSASTRDSDFARSMSLMEAAREAGVYLNKDLMQVFRGEQNSCRDRLLKNCCTTDSAGAGMSNQSVYGVGSNLVFDILMDEANRQALYAGVSSLLAGSGFSGTFSTYGVSVAVNGSALPAGSTVLFSTDSLVVAFDPWTLAIAVVIYVVMSMASCNEQEGRLAMKEGAGLCHTIGSYCSGCFRLFGKCVSCTEHTTGKCCFNSRLARIVQEQGRTQIGKGWGTAQNPDCSGFTVAQLQQLDFGAMDMTEFYQFIIPKLPNAAAIQQKNTNRSSDCYYGQGKCQ